MPGWSPCEPPELMAWISATVAPKTLKKEAVRLDWCHEIAASLRIRCEILWPTCPHSIASKRHHRIWKHLRKQLVTP